MAYVRSNLNEILAELPGVQAEVRSQAEHAAVRIRTALLPHIRTGALFRSVEVKRAFKGKDQWINVSASYVVPANAGWESSWAHRHIKGINFMKAAVYGG